MESERDPSTDPLVYWTNGGPGCSGLIGLLAEQGPFRPARDKSVALNPYRWNRIANVIFVEQPCGVGYSYSNHPGDFFSSDAQSAQINYDAIIEFLTKFPTLQSNRFIIASESYGGHYAPLLASRILQLNPVSSIVINLQGMMVGNPFVNIESGYPSMIQTLWGHQLLPLAEYQRFNANCNNETAYLTDFCMRLAWKLYDFIGQLNPYALDFGYCPTAEYNKRNFNAQRIRLLHSILGSKTPAQKSRLRGAILEDSGLPYEVCEDTYIEEYLNAQSVKEALHVEDAIRWEACSNSLSYSESDIRKSVLSAYADLIDDASIDILIYSGDDDSICGTIGSQQWLQKLKLSPEEACNWKAYYVDDNVAGYFTRYQGTSLKFLTIHGAGHEVPTYTPAIALDMLYRFIGNDWS